MNIAGGLHHAMRGYAAGFCVFNDVVLAIRTMLAAGREEGRVRRHRRPSRRRRAGRVLRRPARADDQPAPGSAHALPGHGHADGTRDGRGRGHVASTSRCRRARTTTAGCARSARSCPAPSARSRRTSWSPSAAATPTTRIRSRTSSCRWTGSAPRSRRCTALAHDVAGGKWVAFGGGGYGIVRCVPRTWTHLLAEATGVPVDPLTAVPQEWTDYLRARGARARIAHRDGRRPRAGPGPVGAGRRQLARPGDRRHAATPCSRCSDWIPMTPATEREPRRTGRRTSSSPTAARCTCVRSVRPTPRRWSRSTPGCRNARATCATSPRTRASRSAISSASSTSTTTTGSR